MRYILAALCAAFLAAPSFAQWGPRGCSTVVQLAQAQSPSLQWYADRSAPGQIDLFRGNRFVGAYNVGEKVYRRLIDHGRNVWSAPEPLPADAPALPATEPIAENFGVDLDKLHQEPDGYRIGGRKVTKQEAYQAVENGLPDDSGKLRLTIIGTDEERKRVEAEFNASELSKDFLLWSVAPDHWSLKDNNTGRTVFKTDGHPTIYVQAPDGKVLHRQDDGANLMEALRKAKDYDPKKDADLRKTSPAGPLLGFGSIPMPLIVFGGLFLLAFLKSKGAPAS